MTNKNNEVNNKENFKEKELNKLQEDEIKEQLNETNKSINSNNEILINLRIIELEQQLLELQKKERESLLRASAEIENIRRRTEQDIQKAHKFALEKLISELLPVIDNLERSIELINQEDNKLVLIFEGLELILKSFLSTLVKYGVKVISEKNIPFNPELHEAMTMIESKEYKPNQVINIMQKGYTLNNRLLRPAMVTVSKSKEN